MTAPTTFRVIFDRIGRDHDVAPLLADARDATDLAEHIHRYARPYLVSRDVEVFTDLQKMSGSILCGLNNGGTFRIERVASETPAVPAGDDLGYVAPPPESVPADQLLTPREVASMFRVDPKTVTRWAKAGRIPAIRTPGRHHRFRESDVRALVEGGDQR